MNPEWNKETRQRTEALLRDAAAFEPSEPCPNDFVWCALTHRTPCEEPSRFLPHVPLCWLASAGMAALLLTFGMRHLLATRVPTALPKAALARVALELVPAPVPQKASRKGALKTRSRPVRRVVLPKERVRRSIEQQKLAAIPPEKPRILTACWEEKAVSYSEVGVISTTWVPTEIPDEQGVAWQPMLIAIPLHEEKQEHRTTDAAVCSTAPLLITTPLPPLAEDETEKTLPLSSPEDVEGDPEE